MGRIGAFLALLLGLVAGPAAAATGNALSHSPTTTTLTFSGRFTSGRDNAGLFGPWGANLAGKPFTATYEVVTFANSSVAAGVDSLSLGLPTAISFSLKINNRTQGGSANTLGSVGTRDGLSPTLGTGFDRVEASVTQTSVTGALTRTFDLSTSVQSAIHNLLDDTLASGIPSLKYNVVAGDSAAGSFQIRQSGSSSAVLSYGLMAIDRVEVVTVHPLVAAVPEPGEWAMLLAGLGVIGAAARRRRL